LHQLLSIAGIQAKFCIFKKSELSFLSLRLAARHPILLTPFKRRSLVFLPHSFLSAAAVVGQFRFHFHFASIPDGGGGEIATDNWQQQHPDRQCTERADGGRAGRRQLDGWLCKVICIIFARILGPEQDSPLIRKFVFLWEGSVFYRVLPQFYYDFFILADNKFNQIVVFFFLTICQSCLYDRPPMSFGLLLD
jgi:hypothetical protein